MSVWKENGSQASCQFRDRPNEIPTHYCFVDQSSRPSCHYNIHTRLPDNFCGRLDLLPNIFMSLEVNVKTATMAWQNIKVVEFGLVSLKDALKMSFLCSQQLTRRHCASTSTKHTFIGLCGYKKLHATAIRSWKAIKTSSNGSFLTSSGFSPNIRSPKFR